MKQLLLALLLPFAAFSQTTYPAASCSQTDVQHAINLELATPVDGDIVTIPAGTCAYTGSVDAVTASFTKNVTIQGAGAISATTGGASTTGTDQTVLLNHLNNNRGIMSFQTLAGKSIRVTGIAFTEDGGTLGPVFVESLNIGGSPPPTPTASLSPTSLTFPNQGVGTTSTAQSFTFTNTGSGNLVISTITISGDFAQTNNCPFSLPGLSAGQFCTFNVTFTPTATGTRPGNVTITSNASNTPSVESLTGTGIPPTLNGVVIKGVQISGGVQVTQ